MERFFFYAILNIFELFQKAMYNLTFKTVFSGAKIRIRIWCIAAAKTFNFILLMIGYIPDPFYLDA